MSDRRSLVVVLCALGAAGCAPSPDPSGAPAECRAGPADSARAVAIALDTLHRLDRFQSVVNGVRRDSGSFRIVTMPAPDEHLLDGMAVVRVGPDCRVVSLIQTDSA